MSEYEQYRVQLEEQLKALQNNPVQSVQTTDGRVRVVEEHASNVDEEVGADEVERDVAIEDLALANIVAIEAALKRINNGEYGVCIDCDEVIPAARLDAFPAAARCIGCKQVYEANNP